MRRFGRHGRDPDSAAREHLIDAISRIRREQRSLEARIATAMVDSAALDRALRDQRQLLEKAAHQIADALAGARQAADGAAAGGDGREAAPYRQAVAGFAAQLQAVQASGEQLRRLGTGAAENTEEIRRLLSQSAASLDGTLRAEIELLGHLERLDRERTIAEQ